MARQTRSMNRPRLRSPFTLKGALATFVLAASAGLSTPSCDEADKLFDCQSICRRYQTCFSSGYDVDACRSRCTDSADRDVGYPRRADDCQACIDDRSCASAAFGCATRCLGIVP
jgi:hypothetical protein